MKPLLVALALVLAAAACAATDGTGRGFAVDGDRLWQTTTTTTPPDPWLVDVATVRPEVNPIIAYRDGPGAAGAVTPTPAAREAEGDLAVAVGDGEEAPGANGLTPIPSPGLSWDSTAIPEGWAFDNPTKIGNNRVFVVVEDRGDWLRVMMPTRPNDEEGWIRAADVTRNTHRWHIEIDVSDNRLEVWEGNELRITTSVVDGKPSTPTPLGRFYVNDFQQNPGSSVYGPWIVSTDAFSDSLERFSGTVPIFAMHGTNNPGAIGTDISNGCVRVPNEVIEQIATTVPLGTPVTVSA